MKIESALKHFSPKTMNISDTSRATASEALTGTDVMGAFGMCQSKSPLGVAAVLAKAGLGEEDKTRAVNYLLAYARSSVPRLIIKGAGAKLLPCLTVMCKLAFEEYTRSAASQHTCPDCDGRGITNGLANVMVHPGCGENTPPKYRLETTEHQCVTCHGKGFICARCRCNGTGRVRDLEQSKLSGCPVEKECDRCSGKGYRRKPSSKAYKVVSVIVPDLHVRTWERNWKPFFDALVSKLEMEESHADAAFKSVTRY
ncbi:MAG: antitermination protein [Pantoea sp.]|uniref:antitermination protein Q n=1 Tax=Pantoea sp. TaxID=69393 RepID=UPI0029075203|nr:antitermination protein [Pantoea sp.]MDU5780362.1 antitermination protein [Pantoea sp.]